MVSQMSVLQVTVGTVVETSCGLDELAAGDKISKRSCEGEEGESHQDSLCFQLW